MSEKTKLLFKGYEISKSANRGNEAKEWVMEYINITSEDSLVEIMGLCIILELKDPSKKITKLIGKGISILKSENKEEAKEWLKEYIDNISLDRLTDVVALCVNWEFEGLLRKLKELKQES